MMEIGLGFLSFEFFQYLESNKGKPNKTTFDFE